MLASVNGANIANDMSNRSALRMSAFCEGGREFLKLYIRTLRVSRGRYAAYLRLAQFTSIRYAANAALMGSIVKV